LGVADLRWVEFRLADTSWRAQAETASADSTILDQAQKQLEELIRTADNEADRDLVWLKHTNHLEICFGRAEIK
jgi:hypothetical protein